MNEYKQRSYTEKLTTYISIDRVISTHKFIFIIILILMILWKNVLFQVGSKIDSLGIKGRGKYFRRESDQSRRCLWMCLEGLKVGNCREDGGGKRDRVRHSSLEAPFYKCET